MKSEKCAVAVCPSLLLAVTVLVVPAYARLTETCLTGTAPDVTNDPSQITAVRALVDAGCPCSSFDGTAGKTHAAYVKCAANIVKAQAAIPPGNLRPQCASTVKSFYVRSTCGVNSSVHAEPCIQKSSKTGKITCAIKATTKKNGVTPANACSTTTNATRVDCPSYTHCIDAADTNQDLIIAAPGDSGMCVPTPTNSPASTPTPTATATPSPSPSVPSSCTNGSQDPLETGFNCGGVCPPCQDLLLSPLVFDGQWYISYYPDLLANGITTEAQAQQHWLTAGIDEGRRANPQFSSVLYLSRYPDLGLTSYRFAIEHYVSVGYAEGLTGD